MVGVSVEDGVKAGSAQAEAGQGGPGVPGGRPTARALFITYHYPPLGTTGSMRLARFVKSMPTDIAVEVLTVGNPPESRDNTALAAEVEGRAVVHTAPMLAGLTLAGAEKALAAAGYPLLGRVALKAAKTVLSNVAWLPDRQIAWLPGAIAKGSELLATGRFDVIFCSSPPHSTHLIGRALKRRFGLPLVVDLRDPWSNNPQRRWPTPVHERIEHTLETRVMRDADFIVANTPGNKRMLLDTFPGLAADKIAVITNGFDPERRAAVSTGTPRADGRKVLLYTGHVYDGGEHFLAGLKRILVRDPTLPERLVVRFLGTMDPKSSALAESLVDGGLAERVGRVPADRIPGELAAADALLYVVPPHGWHWIPSKVYDYLLPEKPILAVLPRGDAWDLLEASGLATLVEDLNSNGVAVEMETFVRDLVAGRIAVTPDRAAIDCYDGVHLTESLAAILRRAVSTR